MTVKNLMEDIVSNVVREVLKKDNEISKSAVNEQDIIAYVLNRVSPRYITSERGIIHGKLESRFKFQQRTDILFLIHEAIQNIKNRRELSSHTDYARVGDMDRFLPHIMGEVLEETTFSIIPDIEVSLLFKGKPAPMLDEGWNNPYITNKATKGYYHFWPKYIPKEMKGKKELSYSITFTHPKFNSKEIDVTMKAVEDLNLYESKVIPIVLLQIKEGVDISFLYE